MLRVELDRKSLLVRSSHRWRRISYLCLTPLVLTVLAVFVAIVARPTVLRDLQLAWGDPRFYAVAGSDVQHVTRKSLEQLLAATPPPVTSELTTLNLFLDGNSLGELQASMLTGDPKLGHADGGDKPYCPAVLVRDQQPALRVSVCYRGHCDWHHRSEKPSLRIKLRQPDVTAGVDADRFIELQRPEDVLAMKNWLPHRLAADFGLLTDRAEHVRLFMNNRFLGVYLQTMRPGEPLAVAHQRMPGVFFKDNSETALWSSVSAWEPFDAPMQEDLAQFDRCLRLLEEPPTPDVLRQFSEFVDLDAFARWAAVMTVCGGVHSDGVHNHVLFLDATRGKLETLPWDVHGYGMLAGPDVPVDVVMHPLMNMATHDPRWVHLRNVKIHELLNGAAEESRVFQLIDDRLRVLRPELRADPLLLEVQGKFTGWQGIEHSALDIDRKYDELRDWIRRRNVFLRKYLSDADVRVSPSAERSGWSEVQVFGGVAVRVLAAEQVPLTTSWQGDPGLLFPGLSEETFTFHSRPDEMIVHLGYAEFSSMTYLVEGDPDQLNFRNAVTGEPVIAQRGLVPSDTPVRTIHPSALERPPSGDVVLGPGEIQLASDVIVEPTQRLIIRPGTTIAMNPGVGIYSQGPVFVRGEAEQPVVIRAATDAPWAAFGVAGLAASGSTFQHMRVSGGSLGTFRHVRFKGMFDLYHCGEVTLEHCEFASNRNSDDTVNLTDCQVTVRNCVWRNANADALDLDQCRGEVVRCRMFDSGNDSLDLMSCDLRVSDCEFVRSGDKGISVGEKTRVFIDNCRMIGCNTGIEPKDASQALAQGTTFTECNIAVHSYQKKWLYGRGGMTALRDCRIENSRRADVSMEPRSDLTLCRTAISSVFDGADRIHTVDQLGDEWNFD